MNDSPVIPAQSQLRSHISATNDARVYRNVSTRSTKGWKIDRIAAPRTPSHRTTSYGVNEEDPEMCRNITVSRTLRFHYGVSMCARALHVMVTRRDTLQSTILLSFRAPHVSGRLEVARRPERHQFLVSGYMECTHPFGRAVTLLPHITVTFKTDEQHSSSKLLNPTVNICDLVFHNNTWGVNTIDLMLQSKSNWLNHVAIHNYYILKMEAVCSSQTSTTPDGLIRTEHLRYRLCVCVCVRAVYFATLPASQAMQH